MHSEYNGSHTLLISVLPVKSLEKLAGHPALSYRFTVPNNDAGDGFEDLYFRVDNADALWIQALNKAQHLC